MRLNDKHAPTFRTQKRERVFHLKHPPAKAFEFVNGMCPHDAPLPITGPGPLLLRDPVFREPCHGHRSN